MKVKTKLGMGCRKPKNVSLNKIIRAAKQSMIRSYDAKTSIKSALKGAREAVKKEGGKHKHQDLCVLPSKSSLHISGKLLKSDGTAAAITTLVNNAICHLFEDVRYELNAVEIDKCENVGLTSLLKGFASLNPGQSWLMENAGWLDVQETKKLTDADGNFDVVIPLSMMLGFAEDYRKIVVNAKHELILTRSKSDVNAIVQNQDEDFRIVIDQVEWLVPYVKLSDQRKVALLNFIEKDTPVSMSFRSWELYEYPLLPATTKHVWTVKTSTHLEKP
nr:uncharacterized protein LOC124223324 [Neodiprion pinetum]